jgi:fucose permease
MSNTTVTQTAVGYNPGRLFVASCIALIATAMTFAVRGDTMGVLGSEFHLTNENVGAIAGIAFLGFTISIVIGGQVCDAIGMGRLLTMAFVAHVSGIFLTIFATGYWTLWTGTLLIGMGNGLIESAVNPLVATIYSNDKTHCLNRMHAWFPGGIAIGGVAAFLISQLTPSLHLSEHLSWQIKTGIICIPVVIYGLMFLGQSYPATERVQSKVSTGDMYKELLRPLFLLWVFCMLLTSSTELANEQWLPTILQNAANASSILVLVWINTVMLFGRSLAGPVVHKLSPTGLLIGSAFFSMLGLVALSFASNPVTAFGAATIFAVGVCYFWPTMLGVTSERFPKGGPLLLGVMGAVGNLSVNIVLPVMGHFLDLKNSDPTIIFRYMAVLPTILVAIFGMIYASDRAKGGYKPEELSGAIANATE